MSLPQSARLSFYRAILKIHSFHSGHAHSSSHASYRAATAAAAASYGRGGQQQQFPYGQSGKVGIWHLNIFSLHWLCQTKLKLLVLSTTCLFFLFNAIIISRLPCLPSALVLPVRASYSWSPTNSNRRRKRKERGQNTWGHWQGKKWLIVIW